MIMFTSSHSISDVQGVNISQGGTIAIKLRLRKVHSPDEFYEFEFVLGTMLHELSHIIHHHHRPPFYELMKELTEV